MLQCSQCSGEIVQNVAQPGAAAWIWYTVSLSYSAITYPYQYQHQFFPYSLLSCPFFPQPHRQLFNLVFLSRQYRAIVFHPPSSGRTKRFSRSCGPRRSLSSHLSALPSPSHFQCSRVHLRRPGHRRCPSQYKSLARVVHVNLHILLSLSVSPRIRDRDRQPSWMKTLVRRFG